jgi:predicted MFS family arabinose efflux permease
MGWRTGFFLLGGLLICTAAFGFLIAPSSKFCTTSDVKGYLSSFKQAFHQGSFKHLMLANILRQGAYWSTFTYIPAFLLESYALDTEGVAPILFIIAIGQLSGMLTGGVLADRFNKIKVCLLLGLLVGLTGSILMGLPNRLWLAVILGGIFTGCFGASQPPFFSTTVTISQTLRGTIMGIQGAFNHIGRSLGALFGGMVLVFWDYRMMGAICLVLSFTASAVFCHIAAHTGKQNIDHDGV